jgi:hypothetical protein
MGPCHPTIEAKRFTHIRHMIVGLAVASIVGHGIIVAGIAIVGYLSSTCA